MSVLLDQLIAGCVDYPKSDFDGKWYVAQPINPFNPFFVRLSEAWKVFRGRAFTYHFKAQEQPDDQPKH